MKEYLITWQINCEGDNPAEAAARALITMRDPQSTATVFIVTDETTGTETKIDLEEQEHDDYAAHLRMTGI